MADYRKYAENLIGNWNTDQYEKQRDVTNAIYNTNWKSIQNEFSNYLDKVKNQLSSSRNTYYDTLSNLDKSSAQRINNIAEDLASRGLTNSGFADTYSQADTSAKGTDTNTALSKIVNTNNTYGENLGKMVSSSVSKENELNEKLGNALGKIAGNEEGSKQAYANVASGIAEQARAREMANALANARLGGSGGTSKKKEADDLERRMLIADTLSSTDLTDNEKIRYMSIYLDVPSELGERALKAYKDNVQYDKLSKQILNAEAVASRAGNALKNNVVNTKDNPLYYYVNQIRAKDAAINPNSPLSDPNANPYISSADRPAKELNDYMYNNALKTLNSLKDKKAGLTYTDLYNMLYETK